jgi:hypothetical protein
MKTLIIFITFSLTAAIMCAQEVTVLDEARLFYAPLNAEVSQQGDSYIYNIKESASQKFARNPIAFMKANFDIQRFISQTAKENYHSYLVTFISNNGSLEADFDRNGKLLETRQKFDNVILPSAIRNNVFSNYKGYSLTKAKYSARTEGEILAKATYSIRLDNGTEKQNLKIDARSSGIGVAVN